MSPEANRIMNYLASAGPLARATVEKQDAHDILLETSAQVLSRGRLYNIKSSAMGAGVYLLTLEVANP